MTDGLKSEALRDALEVALGGDARALVGLLSRHGGPPGKLNLKLAAAFGAELAKRPGTVEPLLRALAADDAAPDQPRVFLPVAAAHGFTHRLREQREVEPSWAALHELAADPRGPVRLGTLDALREWALREPAVDALIARALGWLDDDERERAFAAAALVIELLSDARVLRVVREPAALLEYLSLVVARIADAPRAAARSEGRRRALVSLPKTLAAVVALLRGQHGGLEWFSAECERVSHPDLRAAFSSALIELQRDSNSPGGSAIDALRATLEASAKPLRDAARVRPGHGRGRRSRPTR
jgi:hypothetical protein